MLSHYIDGLGSSLFRQCELCRANFLTISKISFKMIKSLNILAIFDRMNYLLEILSPFKTTMNTFIYLDKTSILENFGDML